MDNLNLDIDTYSDKELERLFSLKSDFSRDQVIKGKKTLLIQLQQQSNLGPELRRNVQMFIDTASQKLAIIADNTKTDDKAGTWAMRHAPLMVDSGNNVVIENPNTIEGRNAKIVDGRMGGTDDTPPGWLNPINIRTLLIGMNVDSRFRPNYYATNASDFTVQLPNVMRKITNMRIATVEIPMTFYGISRARGNATMVITSATTVPFASDGKNIIDNTTSHPVDPGLELYHPAWDNRPPTPPSSRLVWKLDTPVLQMNDSGLALKTGSIITAKQAILQGVKTLSSDITNDVSFDIAGVVIELGWLVILPDGNYEMSWQAGNNAADITLTMNNSFTSALPGFLVVSTGVFWCFAEEIIDPTSSGVVGYAPISGCGIRPYYDLCYNVDRKNGKSIIAIPEQGEGSVTDGSYTSNTAKPLNPVTDDDDCGNASYPGKGAPPGPPSGKNIPPCPWDTNYPNLGQNVVQGLLNLYGPPAHATGITGDANVGNEEQGAFAATGFIVHFVTSPGGNIMLDENIQLFLGWQLGYRAGHYKCDLERVCISEGICLPCGPRYMFLSIDDGLKSSGSNFVAAFAESTLDENVMTRINLSNTLDDVGVYKCASDVGLSNQLNRTREYFGPVDISRLRCRLLDEYGRIIDLNNMDWSMSIVFEKIYD